MKKCKPALLLCLTAVLGLSGCSTKTTNAWDTISDQLPAKILGLMKFNFGPEPKDQITLAKYISRNHQLCIQYVKAIRHLTDRVAEANTEVYCENYIEAKNPYYRFEHLLKIESVPDGRFTYQKPVFKSAE